ncbi:MAG: NfeD family protein [Christensenellales bacterium]
MPVLAQDLTFWQEVSLVFTEIGWIPAICIILGLIFIIVEIFQPGFGFFGICGGILVAVGIAVRMYYSGAGNPIIQLIVMVGVVALVLLLALVIMLISIKMGWLSRTAFIESSTAVSADYSKGTGDFSYLVGKTGITLTALRPSGTVEIDGKKYDVVSQADFIDKDEKVEVIEVEGVRIVVKKYEKKENE